MKSQLSKVLIALALLCVIAAQPQAFSLDSTYVSQEPPRWPDTPAQSVLPEPKPLGSGGQTAGEAKDDILILGDGLAQWIMALASVVALAVSAWGVWLLKHTLAATREAVRSADDAVEVTRELGEAQTRAYLYCRSGRYILKKDSASAIVEIENGGQSPAIEVSIAGSVSFYEVGGFRNMPRVYNHIESKENEAHCEPLPAKGILKAEIIFFFEYNFTDDEGEPIDISESLATSNEILFDLRLRWTDVFARQHEEAINLSAVIDAHPSSLKRGRTTRGSLDLSRQEVRIGARLEEA